MESYFHFSSRHFPFLISSVQAVVPWPIRDRTCLVLYERIVIYFFPFSKLRYGPFGFNPENFVNIWQIKWNWIRSMKFETVLIYFSSDILVCCHPEMLLPWQRNVMTSPLYWILFCIRLFRNGRKLGRVTFREDFWDPCPQSSPILPCES